MIKDILQQLAPLDEKIAALRGDPADENMTDITNHAAELAELSAQEDALLSGCGALTAEDRVFLARHPERPHIDEIVDALFTDFFEQCGDRQCKEDAAILGGVALFHGQPVTVIGHRKGSTLEENLRCNFGMPGPEGYRKALRLMKQAEKFDRPIITFIDTPGAYPGKDAEERGQGEAIARNLMEMSGLTVPVIAVVTGEGSSGGALALGVANRILMLENAVYSVLSPEGFASILWKDSSRSGEACEIMKLTAQDLYKDGIVEEIIPEPVGGAQRAHGVLFGNLDEALQRQLRSLARMNGRQLAEQRYQKFRLIATGGALPGRTVTNEELSRTVDTSDEWITTRTGIRTRHYCTEGENAATLAIAAAKQALQRSGLAPADIACCVCATLSAPDATPSVACQVQAALALPENRPALDVNAACSGFLYGTAVARGLLATLGGRYALVIGTEALSRLMDPADRSTCVLFGDGAGAAVFELTDTSAPFAITLGARGDAAIHAGGPSRAGSAPISMDGRAVFRFAVDALPKCLHTVLDETGLTLDNLDWVVCHQANSRIIDHCVKALHADGAKFYKNMDRHGNTSAASIPVALNELAESGQLLPGQTLACIGFGGGLTWGGMIVEYKG